jgi:hypothetical protein
MYGFLAVEVWLTSASRQAWPLGSMQRTWIDGRQYAILLRVRVLAAIREPKSVAEVGTWRHGKMPPTAFPLSRSNDYSLGSKWQWSVWRLAGEKICRPAGEFEATTLNAFAIARRVFKVAENPQSGELFES